MMISFAWTTLALLCGEKTKTRRSWSDDYAAKFKAGMLVDAYDKSPRIGGLKIGEIEIRCDPLLQRTGNMTENDYKDEGLKWMEENSIYVPARMVGSKRVESMKPREFFEQWKLSDELVYMVMLRLTSITDYGMIVKNRKI
jgi:hypothetical protein